MFEAHAFGKLRLGQQQHWIDQFPTRQVEELIGFLMLSPRVRHTREKLITLLWPDIDVPRGRHRFSIVLSRLRKLFRQLHLPFADYIITTREWVSFEPEQPYFFDRNQFITFCEQAERTKELNQRETYFRSAIELYTGELFTGIYSSWCETEREYLSRLKSRALGQLMHCCMQRQGYDEAIEVGSQILHDDPLREEAHRALMHCYASQGRHDLAAKQYHTCLQITQSEIGEYPLQDTTRLYQQILSTRTTNTLSTSLLPAAQKDEIKEALDTFWAAARNLEALLQKVDTE